MKSILFALWAVSIWACGGPSGEPSAQQKQAAPQEKILDETHKFPKDGLVAAQVVADRLADKDFMPGGNFAEYEAGGKQYQMFFTLRGNGDQALFLFMDYKNALQDAKFIPHLGGYFGMDAGTPALVFQKGRYVIGVKGLDQDAADQAARLMAAYLN